MSFNKRYISKELILSKSNIKDVYKLFLNSDSLILDKWSSNFLKHFDKKHEVRDLNRKIEIENQKFNSNLILPKNIDSFHLSNILFDLKTEPNWIDIIMTRHQLDFKIDTLISGDFKKLVDECIKQINQYYEFS
jgi:hypothetical protein